MLFLERGVSEECQVRVGNRFFPIARIAVARIDILFSTHSSQLIKLDILDDIPKEIRIFNVLHLVYTLFNHEIIIKNEYIYSGIQR